jgi:hypothetical protein
MLRRPVVVPPALAQTVDRLIKKFSAITVEHVGAR